jgi:hypothetical protein
LGGVIIFKKNKKVVFLPTDDYVFKFGENPTPSYKNIPSWYKDMPRFRYGDSFDVDNSGVPNIGLKFCLPFFDSLAAGYMIKTHADVFVKTDQDGNKLIKNAGLHNIVESRHQDLISSIPVPDNYTKFDFVWKLDIGTKTPKGYSLLYTHPLNRFDLPFFTSSGIIDSDKFNASGGYGFCLDKNFEGIIPKGTPVMQVIPIKREIWNHEISDKLVSTNFRTEDPRSKFFGFYKKNCWSRKDYK